MVCSHTKACGHIPSQQSTMSVVTPPLCTPHCHCHCSLNHVLPLLEPRPESLLHSLVPAFILPALHMTYGDGIEDTESATLRTSPTPHIPVSRPPANAYMPKTASTLARYNNMAMNQEESITNNIIPTSSTT